jgi:hypothetical protein
MSLRLHQVKTFYPYLIILAKRYGQSEVKRDPATPGALRAHHVNVRVTLLSNMNIP